MQSTTPNIRHLRAFLAVADCQSISRAMARVYLSQPAITQALIKLETDLGTTLFDRKCGGMYLTATGDVFAERVSRAMQALLDGLQKALSCHRPYPSDQAEQLFHLMTTTQLRALAAVSTARNFSLAGRNLGVSQSAVSRACRELESLLKIPLLEKTSHGILPSKPAQKLIAATKVAFAEVDQGREEVHALHHRDLGQLRVGCLPLVAASMLPGSLLDFARAYPDYRVKVTDGPYGDLLYHLRHADIDILIGALRSPSPGNDVVQETLFSLNVEIVARPDHPLFRRDTVDIDLLADSEWVAPPTGTQTRRIFEDLFTRHGRSIPCRLIESGSQVLTRTLLEGSNRIGLISAHQIQRELNEGTLKILPTPYRQPARPIGITTRREWRPTRVQQVFINLLRGQARQVTSADAGTHRRSRSCSAVAPLLSWAG